MTDGMSRCGRHFDRRHFWRQNVCFSGKALAGDIDLEACVLAGDEVAINYTQTAIGLYVTHVAQTHVLVEGKAERC